MLSTKNIAETVNVAKTLTPGAQSVRLNSISFMPGFNAGSLRVHLNVEGPDMGPDFEGFFIDPNNQNLGRYKGQVGRIRLSPFDYESGVTPTGVKIDRDQSILRDLVKLASALNKREQLDTIEADTIEDFIGKASVLLSGREYFNVVAGGKQYEKGGYTQFDLFIPRSKDGKLGFESASVAPEESKLMEFDPSKHITGKPAAAPAQTVDSFEPINTGGNDFTL